MHLKEVFDRLRRHVTQANLYGSIFQIPDSFRVPRRLDPPSEEIGVDYNLQDQLDSRAKPKAVHHNCLKSYHSPWSNTLVPTTPEHHAEPTGDPPQLTALHSASRPYICQAPQACEPMACGPTSPAVDRAPSYICLISSKEVV